MSVTMKIGPTKKFKKLKRSTIRKNGRSKKREEKLNQVKKVKKKIKKV